MSASAAPEPPTGADVLRVRPIALEMVGPVEGVMCVGDLCFVPNTPEPLRVDDDIHP